jgi:hypothetical protein
MPRDPIGLLITVIALVILIALAFAVLDRL